MVQSMNKNHVTKKKLSSLQNKNKKFMIAKKLNQSILAILFKTMDLEVENFIIFVEKHFLIELIII